MADQPNLILGISRATVSEDGEMVNLRLVEDDGPEYEITMSFKSLGETIVRLLAVAQTAGKVRDELGKGAADKPFSDDVVLPFPLEGYDLGLSDDGSKAVLRLKSDNDLVWNFQLPIARLKDLKRDFGRLEKLAKQRES